MTLWNNIIILYICISLICNNNNNSVTTTVSQQQSHNNSVTSVTTTVSQQQYHNSVTSVTNSVTTTVPQVSQQQCHNITTSVTSVTTTMSQVSQQQCHNNSITTVSQQGSQQCHNNVTTTVSQQRQNNSATTTSQQQCHNNNVTTVSRLKICYFSGETSKGFEVLYNFLWMQRGHSCSPATSFANCVMTLYLLKVHLQTFLSITITQKCKILSCDTLVANELYIYIYIYMCVCVYIYVYIIILYAVRRWPKRRYAAHTRIQVVESFGADLVFCVTVTPGVCSNAVLWLSFLQILPPTICLKRGQCNTCMSAWLYSGDISAEWVCTVDRLCLCVCCTKLPYHVQWKF